MVFSTWYRRELLHTYFFDVFPNSLHDHQPHPFFISYRWLTFINPNYYGFSASTVILLSDFESDCERDGGSELECYTASGDYILEVFGFDNVNPYQNIAVSDSKNL